MEQEQILGELNSQLGQTSLSERTIRDYVAENMPEEGQEFDYVKHVKILTSLNGNFSHDVAAKVDEFKKNYKPQPKKETDNNDDDKNQALIDKLLSRIDALEKNQSESSKAERESSLRAKVESLKDSLKVQNKNLWNDCVKDVVIGDNDSQENVLEKVKQSYEKKLKDYFGEGAAPYGGKSAEQSESEKKKTLDKREAVKAKLKAQGKL